MEKLILKDNKNSERITPVGLEKSGGVREFYIDDYIESLNGKTCGIKLGFPVSKNNIFANLCKAIQTHFEKQWKESGGQEQKILERQTKAIIGMPDHVNYFKDIIHKYLDENRLLKYPHPEWYRSLTDGIFHEVWGLAGISAWMDIAESSSAKIIGDRIYFMVEGKMVLQEQKISPERFSALKKALLLLTPEISQSSSNIEILMHSGERVTIYDSPLTKPGQHIMVFRKYIVEKYTLEEQARRGTIPNEAIGLLKSLAKVGFNVLFCGAVRTAKTTMLTIFEMLEDPELEGVLIETNTEIPLHRLMPRSPIMQLIADGDGLGNISKQLMRSDGDYIICGEARDGNMLNLMVDIANRGTRHCKSTVHLTDVADLPYDIANMIVNARGGRLSHTIIKVAKSFHYVFEFIQLKDRSKKRLKGIYEIRYDHKSYGISIHQILRYEFKTDSWTFDYDIGADKEAIAVEENYNSFLSFRKELKNLSLKFPMKGEKAFIPFYSK
ncbi:MAG: Flp pilus assembly complex ATPase component TadA [Actinobacteria bacterium]|nr:Flp pilus assembly complex ATPase component TadA [Actinomycetota bacterium]